MKGELALRGLWRERRSVESTKASSREFTQSFVAKATSSAITIEPSGRAEGSNNVSGDGSRFNEVQEEGEDGKKEEEGLEMSTWLNNSIIWASRTLPTK